MRSAHHEHGTNSAAVGTGPTAVKNVIEGPNTDLDRIIADVAQHGQLSPGLKAEFPPLAHNTLAQRVEAAVRSALAGR